MINFTPIQMAGVLDLNIFEQRFHSLFHEAPFSAALLSGDDFCVEMANAISLQLWGKDSSIIGKPLLDAIPEIKDQEVYEILRTVYKTGKTYEGKEHVAYLHKNGELTKIYVNLVYKAIKNNEGVITGVFAVGYDVTDQVVARQNLQQSETRTRVAIESTGLGTFEMDYLTGEVRASVRFDEIFGFDHSVEHKEYISRVHPDDQEIRSKAHQTGLETGKIRYEARLIMPAGILRWVKVNGVIIFDEFRKPRWLIGTALDITDEKLSYEKLQDSEQKFRTLITETPEVGVGLYIGRELRIKYVNKVMLDFWGKGESVVGKTMREALPEIEDQRFLHEIDEAYITGNAFAAKYVKALLRRKGKLEVSYFNYSFKPLKDASGTTYAIHHMAVDVTDQVKNNLKVVESEREVRNLFEQTPVGIAVFKGENFLVEIVNETLLSYWGRRREEVINKPIFEVSKELSEQGVERIAKEVFRTGVSYSSPATTISLTRNGKMETIIVMFGFQAMKNWDGQINGVLAIAHEVTDMVMAREKVERNEMRLRFLADSMPQVVWIAEGDGTVTYYNKRVLEFSGAIQNDDGTWAWKGTVHPDDWPATERSWQIALKKRSFYQVEHRILMRDGSYRWHLSRAYAYETDEGIKWYGTATDVHDQKLLEMNLESMVRERTLELQRSNDDLQQFAHVASHDLKEPVRKIKTFSYKLQDEYKDVLGDRGNNFVNKIINASDRMNSMINGVLEYASTTAASAAKEAVDLNQVMETVQNDLEVLIQEKNASIMYSILPTITGIKEQIHQLFYNLVNNALKFSKVNVPSLIEVSCGEAQMNDKTFYEIILSDNGIGFEQDYAEQIFTSFFRLNGKDQYEGSGLGLALCKKIVDRHHGVITAKGEKEKGATFHIFLPK